LINISNRCIVIVLATCQTQRHAVRSLAIESVHQLSLVRCSYKCLCIYWWSF